MIRISINCTRKVNIANQYSRRIINNFFEKKILAYVYINDIFPYHIIANEIDPKLTIFDE